MVTANTSGDIGVECLVAQGRGVAIAWVPGKGGDLGQHCVIAVNHAGEVHHFGQAMHRAIL